MYYKKIKKKIFLVTFFLLFLFLIINFISQIILIPKISTKSLSLKLDTIQEDIIKSSEEYDTLEDFTSYLILLAYDYNIYFKIYDTKNDEVVLENIGEKATNILKKNGSMKKEFIREFNIDSHLGNYEIIITSTFAFDKYLENSMIDAISITAVFGLGILLIVVSFLQNYVGDPIISIHKKLRLMLSGEYIEKVDNTPRYDEIGSINKDISTLYNMYVEKALELQGDKELEMKKERLKREELAIVSHELKTPLTVLKLQTECMESNIGKYKDHDKYLKENLTIINSMQDLVHSILDSIELDQKDSKLNKKSVNIKLMIEELITGMLILSDEKELTFKVQLLDVVKNIDESTFRKAIKNIIENAIKYSEIGTEIKIILDEDYLEVENVNKSITSKQLKNVFKPFSRVDSSRNINGGGTGIGLYIVSESLRKHKYKYSIEKIRDKVKFIVEFNVED